MIGQVRLLDSIDKLVRAGFPRFTIICGVTGSGKRTIARYVASKLGAHLIDSGTKVDEVRQIITMSYKQTMPTVYLLSDVDKMSPAAKNALLKVTEEPPRQAYFIMTLVDLNNTLATLISRATVLNIEPYSPNDIIEYVKHGGYDTTTQTQNIITNLCTCPGEVDTLMQYDVQEFYNYVSLVVQNIGTVSGANAFKIGQKLKYKEEGDGWDITLFLRALMFNYLDIIQTNTKNCRNSIAVISKYLSQLNTSGINKSATIDMLILELRGIWVN